METGQTFRPVIVHVPENGIADVSFSPDADAEMFASHDLGDGVWIAVDRLGRILRVSVDVGTDRR